MAVPDAGCGVLKCIGSHGSPRRWLCGGRCIGSHGSHNCWFVVVETGVLMPVSEADCGRQRRRFSCQSQKLFVGW